MLSSPGWLRAMPVRPTAPSHRPPPSALVAAAALGLNKSTQILGRKSGKGCGKMGEILYRGSQVPRQATHSPSAVACTDVTVIGRLKGAQSEVIRAI